MFGRMRFIDAGAGLVVYIYSITAGVTVVGGARVSSDRGVVMALKRMQVLLCSGRWCLGAAVSVSVGCWRYWGGVGASSTYLSRAVFMPCR